MSSKQPEKDQPKEGEQEPSQFDERVDLTVVVALIQQREPLLVEWAMATALNDKYRTHLAQQEQLT